MKRIVLFLSVLIAFSACDKIDSDNFIDGEIIVQPEDIDRKILIEDFTGHKCQNCPDAAAEIHNIQNTFPNQVVAIAIHAGYFSEPNPPQAPYLTTDFRTEEEMKFMTFLDHNHIQTEWSIGLDTRLMFLVTIQIGRIWLVV